MPYYKDRVLVTTTTTGTGALTQGAAVTGFQAPAAGDDGLTFSVVIYAVDGNGNPSGEWEVCDSVYTHSGTTWSRGTLLASSTGSRINFAAGTKRIAVQLPAATIAGAMFMKPRVELKGGNHTVLDTEDGVHFMATAAVTFTLPTKAVGLAYRFSQRVNSNLIIAGSIDMIHKGNASASSVSFSTVNEKIGAHVLVECIDTDGAGTLKWLVSNLSGCTASVA